MAYPLSALNLRILTTGYIHVAKLVNNKHLASYDMACHCEQGLIITAYVSTWRLGRVVSYWHPVQLRFLYR